MFAVYHGPEGLKTIATRVHGLAAVFSAGVSKLGLETGSAPFFDTVKVTVGEGQAEKITKDAVAHGVNLRVYDSKSVSDAAAEWVSGLSHCDLIVLMSRAGAVVVLQLPARDVAWSPSGGTRRAALRGVEVGM